MNTKIIKWMLTGVAGILIISTPRPESGKASGLVNPIDPIVAQNILNMTVQIKLYAPLGETDQEGWRIGFESTEYVLSKGLGTLVLWQGMSVVVTHNHWGEMLAEAEYVQIQDAYGKLLCGLGIDQFNNLILYSDPGTLVLDAPSCLPVPSTSLEGPIRMTTGDVITVAHQDPEKSDKVNLLQARVVNTKYYKDQLVYKLEILDGGKIVTGDSGGGIWLNGVLVGNMWASFIDTIELPMTADSSLVAPIPSLNQSHAKAAVSTPENQPAINNPKNYAIAE